MATVAASGAAAAPTPRLRVASWEAAVVVAGVAAAATAVTVTLRADFLAYPGWLAVQKADVILGPIAVGLYWWRRRPQSPFGLLLIAVGFAHTPYIFQSSSDAALFTLGVHWEGVIYFATLVLILCFPSGRLRGRIDRLILVGGAFAVLVNSAIVLLSPQIFAGGSISACRAACPDNALLIANDASLATRLFHVDRTIIITVALATAALLLWRLATGTPPQRRALAIGVPIALVFLLTQAGYQITLALGRADLQLNTYVRWLFVGARSALWWGFLLALVAGQLFAGRVLRQIVLASLQRPSLRELEALLRRPLGDPRLRVAFWEPREHVWTDGEGDVVEPPATGSGRTLTEVGWADEPAAAIVHDVQLADDPELLYAAGATALLAVENAQLQDAWQTTLRELRSSRARIAASSAHERLRLERDLHDGAQQRLFTIQIKVDAARERTDDRDLARELEEIADDAAAAVDELRALAHGLYPTVLHERGLADALRSLAHRAAIPVEVVDLGIGRCAPTVEEAVYYAALEAIQNATKHAGPGAHVTVRLEQDEQHLHFAIEDDGVGIDENRVSGGMGITSMRDRIGAIGGDLTIAVRPTGGTAVRGAVPIAGGRETPRERSARIRARSVAPLARARAIRAATLPGARPPAESDSD